MITEIDDLKSSTESDKLNKTDVEKMSSLKLQDKDE